MFENYINEIQKEFQKTVGADVHVYSTQEMLEIMFAIKKGDKKAEDIPCPFIILNISTDYTSDVENYIVLENGNSISHTVDYTKELPLAITVKTVVYALDVQDIIHLEEVLQKEFSQKSILHSEDGIEFDLKLADEEIIRGKNKDFLQKELLYSSISFNSQGAIDSFAEYHPAEIALDTAIQKKLLKQVIALNERMEILEEQLTKLRPEWYIDEDFASEIQKKIGENSLPELEEKINKSQEYRSSEKEKQLIEKIKSLRQYRNDLAVKLFGFKEPWDLAIKLGKNSFLYMPEYLKIMEENSIDLNDAVEQFKPLKTEFDEEIDEKSEEKIHKVVKAEIERLEELRRLKEELERVEKQKREQEKEAKLLESNGDSFLSLYTDAVVAYFKDAFKDENIDFFGGSTLMDWYRIIQNTEAKLAKLPVVVIDADVDFSFDSRVFNTYDIENNQKVFYFNLNTMPIKYSVQPVVCASHDEEALIIAKKIRAFFEEERTIRVPLAHFNNESVNIKLQTDPEAGIELSVGHFEKRNISEGLSLFCKRIIKFKKHVAPYFYRKLSKEELEFNQKLQLMTLKQLQFAMIMHTCFEKKAIHQLNISYKNLFVPPKFLDRITSSVDYKEVSDSIRFGRPVDRLKFDKVLSPLTIVYPCLYDRMMQGWSIEQIKEDLLKLANQYKERENELFDLLEIPENALTKKGSKIPTREGDAIKFYLKEMGESFDFWRITVDVAIEKYVKPYNDREKEFEEDEKQCKQQNNSESPLVLTYYNPDALNPPERYYDNSYSNNDSSSGGRILETAIGTAIGMHGIKKEERKQTRLMEQQAKFEKERYEEEKRRYEAERRRQRNETNRKRAEIIRQNDERRRKGLPPLPVPPGDWS